MHEKTLCKAHSRRTGEPCKNAAMNGTTVCRMHGGSAPQVRRKAAERIAEAAHDAAALLVQFMEDPKNDKPLRTRIAQDLLNRAGYTGRQSLDLSVKATPFQDAIATGAFLVDYDDDAELNRIEIEGEEGV